MESWENKIIADKLNSLQGLPASYTPNLASKWEIIEAGLPLQKKRVVSLWVRWSVAAATIAGMFLIGIKISQNNNALQTMQASVKMSSIPILIANEKEQTVAVTKPFSIENKKTQQVAKPAAAVIETVVKWNKPQLINNELRSDEVIPMIDSAATVNDKIATAIPQPEPAKRAKRKTFQKDFNDGLLVMDTGYSKPASPQFSFKLQLYKSTGDDAQPSRRLQLKQGL